MAAASLDWEDRFNGDRGDRLWARRFARETPHRVKKKLNKPGNRFVSGLHELGDDFWSHENDIHAAIGV